MFQCQTILFMDVHLVKSEQNVGFVAVSITLAQIGFIYIYIYVYIHEYIYIYMYIIYIYIYVWFYHKIIFKKKHCLTLFRISVLILTSEGLAHCATGT